MKKYLPLIILLFAFIKTNAQYSGALPSYKLVSGNDWAKAKNYYLLTLLQQDAEAAKLLKADAGLAKLTADKIALLKSSLAECKDALCLPAKLKFTDDEINTVAERLAALCKPGSALDKLIKTHIIPSGTYFQFQTLAPAQLLEKAWRQDAAAINHTIAVYAEGAKPNYPQIDSISYNVKKRGYYTLMYDCSAEVNETVNARSLFFEPSLKGALTYLEVNERMQAGDYEPMATTVNKPAADKVKLTKWANYPYTHIVVPGAGPDDPNTPFSGEGMLRCKSAARAYFAGKAPFVVVSGGAVHPFKTKYNEAVEMKKYMIAKLHVPASVIIIEPHARHTTTNLRNDARIAFRYGISFSKPGLIVTDKYQNDFIMNMDKRCLQELGYLPYKLGKRLSDTELEFYPLVNSLQIDLDEPMDP
ncbi:YdcF family protein [Mucilaginibacter pallidiroseus]|uniref:YdcF family protein n=1 Tax=Mucilaginibacter pallidiroseus TaxID=2599295 RepID=A0A563TZM7_9SPHI|nr:YdcF family protein [Mucilaginibacter pallidiroseus]TWR24733.1 YdcF family protein [Mucilaginibacter pallidiroseus]